MSQGLASDQAQQRKTVCHKAWRNTIVAAICHTLFQMPFRDGHRITHKGLLLWGSIPMALSCLTLVALKVIWELLIIQSALMVQPSRDIVTHLRLCCSTSRKLRCSLCPPSQKANPELRKPRAKNQDSRDAHIAKKTYYCAVCDHTAIHKQNLDVHMASQKHLKKVLLHRFSGNSQLLFLTIFNVQRVVSES